MSARPEHIVGRWLRKMGIIVSPSLMKVNLNSHPDYPSLRSISDFLDNLGIDNAALVIDKERLNEVPLPFLAHDSGKSQFIIIENIREQISENTEFDKHWNGTALLAEKPEGWRNEENEKQIAADKKSRLHILIAISVIVLLSAISFLNGFSWQMAGLLMTAFAGTGIAILIVQHELGISNEITEQLCSAGKNTDCDSVMHSKGSILSKWMNWADAGIIYFSSFLFLFITALYTGYIGLIFVLSFLSFLSIPFTLYSLYYQWRVVKKWCTLCLLTIGTLWIQFVLLLPGFKSFLDTGISLILFSSIAFTVFLFTVLTGLWFLVLKPAFEKDKETDAKKFSLLRFKYNPAIFKALLKTQRRVNIAAFDHDLQLGNPDAQIQIVVACNPYCRPCAKAHEELHDLLDGSDIGLTVRFTPNTETKEDKRTIAVAYLLQLLKEKEPGYKKQVLYDWYSLGDLEKFNEKYPLQEEMDVQVELKKHEDWSKEAKIEFTPTIFINGYELPKQYKVSELKNILGRMENIVQTSDEAGVENILVSHS